MISIEVQTARNKLIEAGLAVPDLGGVLRFSHVEASGAA